MEKTFSHPKSKKNSMPCFDKEDTKAIHDQYRREGLVCVRNALSSSDADMVEKAVRTMPLKPDPRTPERHTKCLRADHPLHKAMYDDAGLQRLYKTLHGYSLAPTAFPVEVRRYPAHSAGMGWHRDLQMYDDPQTEMVYTAYNDDAQTRFEWVDRKGEKHSLKPQKNDLVLVKPNQALHRVTGLGDQTRGILKWIAHAPKASPLPSMKFEKEACPF